MELTTNVLDEKFKFWAGTIGWFWRTIQTEMEHKYLTISVKKIKISKKKLNIEDFPNDTVKVTLYTSLAHNFKGYSNVTFI